MKQESSSIRSCKRYALFDVDGKKFFQRSACIKNHGTHQIPYLQFTSITQESFHSFSHEDPLVRTLLVVLALFKR